VLAVIRNGVIEQVVDSAEFGFSPKPMRGMSVGALFSHDVPNALSALLAGESDVTFCGVVGLVDGSGKLRPARASAIRTGDGASVLALRPEAEGRTFGFELLALFAHQRDAKAAASALLAGFQAHAGYESAGVFLLGGQGKYLFACVAQPPDLEEVMGLELDAGTGCAGQALVVPESIEFAGDVNDPLVSAFGVGADQVVVAIPLELGGSRFGVAAFTCPAGQRDDAGNDTLAACGILLSVVLGREVIAAERGTLLDQTASARAQLTQAARMAAVGELASGVAHELNQPIGRIMGYAELALGEIEKSHPLYKYFSTILSQSEKMGRIVDNLRTFGRQSEGETKLVDIRDPIEECLRFVKVQFKLHSIRIVRDYEEEVPKILGDPNALQQVFMNFLSNARYAIDKKDHPRGGTVRIAVRVLRPRNQIEVAFSNDGVGIPPDEVDRVLEPFFSTKDPGEGTGLGLAIVQSIITAHKGQISVASPIGKETTFTVSLPIPAEESADRPSD